MSDTHGTLHIGRETTCEAFGQTWNFSRWELAEWAAISDEARKYLPDPIEAITRNMTAVALSDAEVMRALLHADETARVNFLKAYPEKKDRRPPPPMMAKMFRQNAGYLAELALDKASLYLGFLSKELNSWIQSAVGGAFVFWLLLKEKHPSITRNDCLCIAQAIGTEEVERVMLTARGQIPDSLPNEEAPAA